MQAFLQSWIDVDRQSPQSTPKSPLQDVLEQDSDHSLDRTNVKRRKSLASTLMFSNKTAGLAAFNVNGTIIFLVERSLFIFGSDNRLRIALVKIVESRWFSDLILVVIVLNSISIASYDHSLRNKVLIGFLNYISYVFASIYLLEAVAKIIAFGFVLGKDTYLRSPTNVFDFIIVLCSLGEVFVSIFASNVKKAILVFRVLKVFRVIKLLSAFNKIPQMRQQLRTLGRAQSGILNVLFFLGSYFAFVAIIGLQLFSDDIYNACRLTPEPVLIEGKRVWQRAPTEGLSPGGICYKGSHKFSLGGFKCPPQYTCGSYLDYGMPLEDDEVQYNSQLFYNVAIWKNFASSLLAVFQIVTTDSWGNHMYNLINSSNFLTPVLFSLFINFVGTYYLMNLMIVVIMESYIESNEIFAQDDIQLQESQIAVVEDSLPVLYQEYLSLLRQFVISENFQQTMLKCTQQPDVGAKESPFKLNEEQRKPAGSLVLSMQEPEIEDRLQMIKEDVRKSNGSDFFESDSSSFTYQEASLELPDFLLHKLREMHEYLCKLENPTNRQSFLNFMVKAVAVQSLENVDQKLGAQKLIQMELELLFMKFEKELRDQYNEERQVKYGLKQEKKVLNIITKSVHGMFENFTSRRLNQKEKIRQLQQNSLAADASKTSEKFADTSRSDHQVSQLLVSLNLRYSSPTPNAGISQLSRSPSSRGQIQMRDELYNIRKKTRLELRDEIILTLNHMNVLQNDIKSIMDKQDNFAQIAAHDLLVLTEAFEDLHQKETDQIVQLRVKQSNLYQLCLAIDEHWIFTIFISMAIIANFVVLAMERYPSDPTSDIRKELTNIVFFFIFLMEMVIKMIGNGPIIYFQNSFNIFDFIVIVISTIDLVINNINLGGSVQLQAIRALRVFRLLRMFKLAKFWKRFNELLNLLFVTLKKIFFLTCILVLFWMTYAILGKELFVHRMSFVDLDYPAADDFDFSTSRQIRGTPPAFNFNTFIESVVSVFIFFADDGWNGIFQDAFRMPGINKALTIFFFFTLYICGNMVMYQLFRSILLREFDQQSILQSVEEQRNREREKLKSSLSSTIKVSLKKLLTRQNQVQPVPQTEETQDNNSFFKKTVSSGIMNPKKYKDRSLFIFRQDSRVRRFVKAIELYSIRGVKVINAVIYVAIGISSLLPAFQNPFSNSKSELSKGLFWLDAAMTILFTLEVIIKVISRGFLFNGPQSYLRKPSNILDFIVVVVSLSSQFISNVDLSTVKVLRLSTRLTRPMRLVFRDERLKISLKVIGAVLPQIVNLLAIYFLFCLIFATIGVNLLSGRMFYCDLNHKKWTEQLIIQQNVRSEQDCFNMGGVWESHYRNFDGIVSAFVQMFTMSQAVGWHFNLLDVMRSTGVNQQPRITPPYGSGAYLSLFIVIWMIVGYFFIKNLFVGVVIAGYNRESEKTGQSISLTEEQRKLLETELLTFRIKPLYRHQKPKNKCRACVFSMMHGDESSQKKFGKESKQINKEAQKKTDVGFDIFILCVVLINALILVVKWPNMNKSIQVAVEVIGYICTSIFVLEAVIKLTAYGKAYFRESWNIFDLLIVIGSLAFIAPNFKKERIVITFIKTISLVKVLGMLERFKKLQTFYAAITKTMTSMMNIGLLMLLIIYIFAIIGVQLFGQVKLNGPMTELYNFQSVPKACLTLYRVMTRDHWNLLMEALSIANTDDLTCIADPTYEDYIANGRQAIGCGKPTLAVLYFFTFSFITSVVFPSLFIAIILSAYFSVNDKHKDQNVINMIAQFRVEWSQFDPEAKGTLQDKDFEKVMFKLGEPLGWHERHRFDHKLLAHFKLKIAAKMPLHREDAEGRWFFEEVLDQLLFYYLVREQVKEEMSNARIKFEQNPIMKRTRLASPRASDPGRITFVLKPADTSRQMDTLNEANEASIKNQSSYSKPAE